MIDRLFMEWDPKGSRALWFTESGRDGRPGLVRPSGDVRWSSKEMFSRISPETTEFEEKAFIREYLFMDEYGIWDATAFSMSMSMLLNVISNRTEYIFATASHAHKTVFRKLSEEDIDKCKANAERFYKDPDLQAGWPTLILYPVTLKVGDDGGLEPVYIGDIGNSEMVLDSADIMDMRKFFE